MTKINAKRRVFHSLSFRLDKMDHKKKGPIQMNRTL